MKNKNIIYLLVLLVAFNVGCSKSYFDINNNPNAATNTTPELVLPNALKVTADNEAVGFPYLNGWMNYWAPSGSYATSSSDVASYKQTTDSYTGSWSYYYDNLEDYDYVEKQSQAQGKPFYEGVAKVMKSFIFQRLVDMYNNVPYTEALQGTTAITPKYDNGLDIYNAITDQLDSAVTLLQNPSVVTDPAISDIMFQGDASKWIQFANTLRLRILMRQSQMSDRQDYIKTEIGKIQANGGGFLTEDATVNPGYAASTGQQNPTWGYFITLTGNLTSGGRGDYWRANQYPISFMEDHHDPRLPLIYTSVGGAYKGNALGSQNNIPGSGSSSIGPGILKSVDQPAVLMLAAESYFLQAEANLRSYLGTPEEAVTNYKNGVQASFDYLGAGDATTYYSQPGDKNVNIEACATFQEKLACIIRQKWMAFNSIAPFEAWSDYRRLGLPADLPISVSPYLDGPNVPVRILYPTNEYITNAENVNAQGEINGHTSKVFWMP